MVQYTLANNHSIQESVVLSQGADELVQAGTTVNVPATGTTAAISFTTDEDVVLPAGFAEVDNVSVTAVVPGSSGNISTNQLNGTQAFPTPPFTGARAINPAKFTTGADRETDDELKDSIRNWVQSLSRGVHGHKLPPYLGNNRVVIQNLPYQLNQGNYVHLLRLWFAFQ